MSTLNVMMVLGHAGICDGPGLNDDGCCDEALVDECGVCDGLGFSECDNGTYVCDLSDCPDAGGPHFTVEINETGESTLFIFNTDNEIISKDEK